MLVCISERCAKEKKLSAFNRMRVQRIHKVINAKGIVNVSMIMKRIIKNNLSFALRKLKEKEINIQQGAKIENRKSLRSSNKSARHSSSSNILSLSEDSLQESRSILFDDNQSLSLA
jgi:hypothetical protein